MATKGSISMGFELQSPERAVVYEQVRKIVISAFSEDGQAVPALWEEAGHCSQLTGRQGCIPSSRLCLVMSLVAELGREP